MDNGHEGYGECESHIGKKGLVLEPQVSHYCDSEALKT